jgi:hypothetical protein
VLNVLSAIFQGKFPTFSDTLYVITVQFNPTLVLFIMHASHETAAERKNTPTLPPRQTHRKKELSKEIREQPSLIASASSVANSLKNLDCRPAVKKQFKQISGVIFSS